MNSETTQIIKKLLASPQKIVIVGHKNPDGDAIGSCLGLSFFLRRLGHKTNVIMPNDFPDFLKWLPGCEEIIIHDKDTDKSIATINNASVIFTLDFNALNRTGNMQQFLEDSDARFVMIDHHQAPEDYAVATYSDTSMSSTAEMVYHFIDALDELSILCMEVSTQLYTGIMTDTGSFRFPSTTATTHRVIAHLIEMGANNSEVHENIYDVNSLDRMKLLGVALKNLNILPEYNTAYITLSQKELDHHNFKKGDTEGFVNYALSLKGVKFAVIFIENKQDNIIKMSLRSKGEFSVNTLARKHYNGGGHTNAAGGRSTLTLSKTISEFISILPQYKNELTDAS
ncbi:bifunctional oligoribonuclease/PAP phosphatase NrnA [Marixanthomonas sp. SCSIO 43207]|uniref:DHH family phosphoesterase n=1 Tax=Marixanthomonas sp. SCSIO 43207 TaxID=2779360 RepID=UPI001CA8CEF5|nr:bifunctional oligoribonuclease/PAP phosphatase NrnA [Marixanthomonas sp. SCSIO 43207]UAB81125.1 bifunctional oligoribonuclease/PAP phosphatase NrnA [Marixanthomonas sp. SCSIO 43207]